MDNNPERTTERQRPLEYNSEDSVAVCDGEATSNSDCNVGYINVSACT